MTERYTSESIRALVEKDRERLFAPWAVGRQEGWIPDPRMKDLITISYWLSEELLRLGANEADRKTQQSYYHRWSRSEEYLWVLAARILNMVLDGAVEQDRIPHRRWG